MWKNEIHLSWTSPPQTSFSASSAVLFTSLEKGEEIGSPSSTSSTLSSSSSSVLLKRRGGRWTKVWLQKASLFEGGMALFFKLFSYPLSFFSSSSFAGVVHPAVVVSSTTRRNLRPPRGGGGGGGGRVTRAEKELWKNIFLFRSTEIRWTFQLLIRVSFLWCFLFRSTKIRLKIECCD